MSRGLVPRLFLVATLTLESDVALGVSADEYLFVPTVNQGERELDWHLGSASAGDTARPESSAGLAMGLGLTQHWFSEIDLQYRREVPYGSRFDAVEWENIVQLGEPGEWPIDLGALLTVEVPGSPPGNVRFNEGPSVRFGPLLQKDLGPMQLNLNFLMSRFTRRTEVSATQLGYQVQLKWRYRQLLELGVQAFGRFSTRGNSWARYSDQTHRIGPVVLGRVGLPRERSLAYNLGLLMGTSAHSPDRTIRMQVEYEF